MSNEHLHAEVRQLERQLSEVQSANSALIKEITQVQNAVVSADNELRSYNERVRNALDMANGRMVSSHERVWAAHEMQGQIDHIYREFKNVETANKKIRECNNKKYYEFASYRTVRKLVQGMMDNLDKNMVGNEIVMKSVERQQLQAPDFWLTCVLISAMAWHNDDRPLAERAMARAFRLNKKDSCIFYMIFNLRVKRYAAAVLWFQEYQKCNLRGSDENTFLLLFSLISDNLQDEMDADTQTEIVQFIDLVIDANVHAAEFDVAQVQKSIVKCYTAMATPITGEYTSLKTYCTEYETIMQMVGLAVNNRNILAFFLEVIHISVADKNMFLSDFLDNLITKPNDKEKDVADEIAYNELIIQKKGSIEAARAEWEQRKTQQEAKLNLVSEMIRWIYTEQGNINPQMRRSMLVLTKNIQKKAYESYTELYRSQKKDQWDCVIGEYKSRMDFRDPSAELEKICKFFSDKQNAMRSAVKIWPAYVSFAVSVVCAVGTFFAGWWLLTGTVLGVVYAIYALFSKQNKMAKLATQCTDEARRTKESAARMFRDYEAVVEMYEKGDSSAKQILEELDRL